MAKTYKQRIVDDLGALIDKYPRATLDDFISAFDKMQDVFLSITNKQGSVRKRLDEEYRFLEYQFKNRAA